MSNLTDYLDFVWGDVDGYGCITVIDDKSGIKRVYPKWPEQRDIVIDFVLKKNAQGYEVHATPAMWKDKVPAGSNAKEYFLCSNVLWADMDGNAPESWPPEGVDDASVAIPAPSMRVQSSTSDRQHLYWRLEEPITDVNIFENKNRTIAYMIKADPGGWDAPQLLRPPDTTNHGYSKPERKGKTYPVIIEEQTDTKHSASLFPSTKDFRPLVKDSIGDIPDCRKVLTKYDWPDYFWNLFSEDPPEGKRSDYLQAVAYTCAEVGATNEEVYSLIHDCDDRWGKYKNRTDRHTRLVDIVERAKEKHPTALSELTFDGLMGDTQTDKSTEDLKTLYTFTEFMKVKVEIDWILEGLLHSTGYGIIAGPSGLGKTQLAIRFAEKILRGESWLGWKNANHKKRKIVILSLEMDTVELQYFFKTMSKDGKFMTDAEERLFILPLGEPLPINTPEGKKFLDQTLDEIKPDVMIIDSLSKSMAGNFNDNDSVIQYNKHINYFIRKHKMAIVNIHHNRKNQDKKQLNNTLDDLYGSRFLAQDATFVLMGLKSTTEEDSIDLMEAKIRFAPDGNIRTVKRTAELDFWTEGIGNNNDDLPGIDDSRYGFFAPNGLSQ